MRASFSLPNNNNISSEFRFEHQNVGATFSIINVPDISNLATKDELQQATNIINGDIDRIDGTIATYGNIVTHNVTEFATSEQGSLAESALQEIPSYYITETELTSALITKQDVINDLSEIRAGAGLGSTSLQPNDISNMVTSVNGVTAVNGNVTISIPTDTSDLTNGAGFITGASVSNLTDVNLTSLSDGQTLTYNSSSSKWINSTINSATWGNITGTLSNQTDLQNALNSKQNTIDSNNKLDYAYISNTPTIPTVNDGVITFTQGGITKGTISVNQSGNTTIALDAGSGSINVVQETGQSTTNVMSQKAVTDSLVENTSLLLPSANSIQLGENITLYNGGKLYNKSIFLTAGTIADSTSSFTGNIQMWADTVGREFVKVNSGSSYIFSRTAHDHYTIMALFFDANGYVNIYTRGEKVYTGIEDVQDSTMTYSLKAGLKLFSTYIINSNIENIYLSYIYKDGKGDWYPNPKMMTQSETTLTWTNVTGRTVVQIDTPNCWWDVEYSFTNDTSSAISGQLPCQGTLLWDSNGRSGAAFTVPANSTYSGKCIVSTNAKYLVLADSAGKLKQTVTAKRIIVENGIDARLCINGGYFNPHLLTYVSNNGLALSATKLIPEIAAYSDEARGYVGQIKVVSNNIQMWNGSTWKQISN